MSLLVKLPEERYEVNAFADFSLDSNFNVGTARALAWTSQLAYETDEPDKIAHILKRWQLTLVADGVVVEEAETVLPKSSTRCFVAHGRAALIIAFAGTDPLVLANWITDFDMHIDSTGAARGYDVATQAVWPRVLSLIAKYAAPDDKILVTGQSLGAALAALTAHKIDADAQRRVHAVYAYGMPRPGDAAFAAAYDAGLGQRTYRLVYGDDIVPTVAPSTIGFRHVGRYLHCKRGEKFDQQELSARTDSEEPQFVKGLSTELRGLLDRKVMNWIMRFKLAAALALGHGPAGMA
jgi:triacylglycerol lipase